MWSGLEKILEHVSSYSTNAGKLWYLLVFVFRLIVVVTVGQSVYSDEQSAFRCSTKVIGCDNVCYDRFSKISHIRFWAFQLLAVTAPAVIFHFYSLNVRGRIEKIKHGEIAENESIHENDSVFGSSKMNKSSLNAKERKRLLKRRKSVGAFKEKKVYANHNLINVHVTRTIRIAYTINVVLRIVIEALSLYFAYKLFHFTDYTVADSTSPFDFILIRVPQVYRCDGENVKWACGQHLNLGGHTGYVPCWVSRPWEKTIFMCYMNILSALCFILSVIELLQLLIKYATNLRKIKKKTTTQLSTQESKVNDAENPFQSFVDETNGRKTMFRSINSNTEEKPLQVAKRPENNGLFVTNWVPLRIVKPRVQKQPGKKDKKRKTTKIKSIGIRVHEEHDDEGSLNSDLYHSSEYEDSDTGEDTLPSVSHVGSHY